MAEVVVYIVSSIGAALGGATGAALIINAVQIGTALFYAGSIALSLAYSNQQKRRAQRQARDAYNASLQDRLVMTTVSDGQRSRVYGRVRNTDGVLFKATRGADSRFYTLVVALAGHEVDAIETVYFDDVPVTLDGSGYVQDEPWNKSDKQSGSVTSTISALSGTVTLPQAPITGTVAVVARPPFGGARQGIAQVSFSVSGSVVTYSGIPAELTGGVLAVSYQYSTSAGKARVRKYLGTAGQDLSTELAPLFPGLVTSADKFAGIALLLVDLEYDPDAFPGGVPQISAVVRGAKVLDTRTSTTAWTQNPALIAHDWARYKHGGNLPADCINTALVNAAANACDVSTVFTSTTSAGTTTTTRPLFTCGMVCRTDQDPSQALDEIIESMAGRYGYSGGVLHMRAGVYRAPVATLTEDWLSGADQITIVAEPPAEQAINIARVSFADAANAYTVPPALQVVADAYISLDGQELPTELTFAGVTDADHAQHIGGIVLREARSGLVATVPCNLRAFQLELFDVINVSLPRFFGGTPKLMEVADRSWSMGGGVVLTLRETAASIFDPDAEFTREDATPNTALPNPFAVPEVQNLDAESGAAWLLQQADGTIVSRMHITWDAITDAAVVTGGRIEVRYGPTDRPEAGWQTLEVPGGDAVLDVVGVSDGEVYAIKARARNALVRGPWCKQITHKVVGKTAAPAAVAGFAGTVAKGRVLWKWTPLAEGDYAETEVRSADSNWGSTTVAPLFRGTASNWAELVNATGTLTRYARHFNTSGNFSASSASASVTVAAGDLVQDGAASITATLSRDSVTLAADSTGVVASFTDAVTTISVFEGVTNVTGSWTISRTNGTGVTSTLSTATLTVTALANDTGYVDITATRTGFPTQTKRFGLTKARAATPASAPVPLIPAVFSQATAVIPAAANAQIQFRTDGTVYAHDDTGFFTEAAKWYDPTTSGIGSAYEVRATLVSGNTPTTSALNTWLALSSNRAWTLSQTTVGSKQCQLQFTVRLTGGAVVSQGTGFIYVEATN